MRYNPRTPSAARAGASAPTGAAAGRAPPYPKEERMRVDQIFENARAAGTMPVSFEMFPPKARSPSSAPARSPEGSPSSHRTS